MHRLDALASVKKLADIVSNQSAGFPKEFLERIETKIKEEKVKIFFIVIYSCLTTLFVVVLGKCLSIRSGMVGGGISGQCFRKKSVRRITNSQRLSCGSKEDNM